MLRTVMEEKGYNMLTLSKEIGKNAAYMQQFFEKGVPRMLGEDVRFALAKALGLEESQLRIGPQRVLPGTQALPSSPAAAGASGSAPHGRIVEIAYREDAVTPPRPIKLPKLLQMPPADADSQPLEPVAVPLVSTMAKDVPVLGTAVGGDDAEFEMNGQIIDYVRRPPGIEHARDVFAIFVVGSSMEPRFEEGEMVYVNPRRVPRIGDYVLVELHGKDDGDCGRCLIKRLVKRSPAGLVLEQFNPPRDDLQYSASEIKAVHRIMPWTEVLGI